LSATHFSFDVSHHEGRHFVGLHGELDVVNAASLRDALVEIAGSTVAVDLSDLTFIDAAGLGALASARREIEESGNKLELLGARPSVRRTFTVAGLAHLLGDAEG